ncbi:MAG: hypothetical protein GY754_36460 [bacterium]|nr:hypothetical protein [bacterium]
MQNKRYNTAAILLIAGYAVMQVILGASENLLLNQVMPMVMVLFMGVFVALHGHLRYGIKHMLVL